MSEHAVPMRSPYFTRGTLAVLAVAVVGISVYLGRMTFGLQTFTNLNDQWPWGIWIALDVATGIALAAGGFTSAALVHIFGRERYHSLVRPALVTAMLGYTFAVIGLLADLGRWYNVWHPILPSMWQGNSVLFEVGMCVMIYSGVLYIEFVPIVVERFKGRVDLPGVLRALNRPIEGLLRLAEATLSRFISVFIIAGVTLSCLHQSSLGTLMVIAPTKMSALWFTPVMPALFLMSAIAVGFPMIIFESLISSRSFRMAPEMNLLSRVGRIATFTLGFYAVAKVVDLTIREAWPLAFAGGSQAIMFWVEMIVGILVPLAMFASPRVRSNPRGLFVAATLTVAGVAINRLNVFLVAYRPPFSDRSYFPTFYEMLLTAGLIATLVLIYRAIVMIFPVIAAPHGTADDRSAAENDRRAA
ncbi:MAG: Ni/Fe-hydrogenase cytochrome b subunit [Acidobacteria bacterium]|nr:Ni/Fe-hydrogenase cytochrome b subunit [Acidobacteriota bacterium]